MTNAGRTERKVDSIVEEILNENRDEDLNATRSCPEDCDPPDDTPENPAVGRTCQCGVENSPRFSLRVMEAMRALQRPTTADDTRPATSTAEDIVEHIRTNYRNDGDLYSQVRTALRQVCARGFVVELLDNEYHLIGPNVSLCYPDCEARATDAIAGRRGRRSACGCRRSPPRRNGSAREETPEETLAGDLPEDLEPTDAIFRSIRRLQRDDEADNAERRDEELDRAELPFHCACDGTRDDIHNDDVDEIGEIDEGAIAGPSGLARAPIPARRETRPEENRRVRVADGNDRETVADEDEVVEVAARRRRRPRRGHRRRVVARDQRRKRRREDTGEDAEEDTNDGTEDSAYRELRRSSPERPTTRARERELKRWIRRCRRECERRGASR